MATKFNYDKVKEIIEKENCELISKNYGNRNEKLKIKCNCNEIFETSLASFMNNKKYTCRKCSNDKIRNERKFNFDYVISYINSTSLNYVSGKYENRRSELLVKCKCGEEFITSFEKVKDRGYLNCRKCRNKKISKTQTKSHKKFKEEINNILGKDFDILETYINDSTKIKMLHKTCNTKFESTPSNMLRGKGCPRCKTSHLEKTIEKYLMENNIKYETQKSFKGLIYKRSLRIDFYLNDYNIAIEADGRQHFESVDIFGGEVAFSENKKRDIIKDNFCKEKNIKLIRIPYYKLRNINLIMDNIFKGNTVVS